MEECQPKYSQFFDDPEQHKTVFEEFNVDPIETEMPLSSCKINDRFWSLLTTRRMITSKDGVINTTNMETALIEDYGNPRNFHEPFTLGTLYCAADGPDNQFFIENGYCNQIMVTGVHERELLQKNNENDNQRKIKMLIRRGLLKNG